MVAVGPGATRVLVEQTAAMEAATAAGVGLKLLYDPGGTVAVDQDVIVCRSHADASRALLEFSEK